MDFPVGGAIGPVDRERENDFEKIFEKGIDFIGKWRYNAYLYE